LSTEIKKKFFISYIEYVQVSLKWQIGATHMINLKHTEYNFICKSKWK